MTAMQVRRVTRGGLRAFLARHMALSSKLGQGGKHFSSLDACIDFSICLEEVFDTHQQVEAWLSVDRSQTASRPVRLYLNARRWVLRVCFHCTDEDEDEDDPLEAVPPYAKEYLRDTGQDFDLVTMAVHEPPTESELDVLCQDIARLQELTSCGCGRYAGASVDGTQTLCDTCELTGCADEPEAEDDCMICMEPVIRPHMHEMRCCGAVMHEGCHQNWGARNDWRCIHCRRG